MAKEDILPEDIIEELKTDHAGIEEKIKKELAHPYPNSDTIAELKRLKLKIKDKLQAMEAA